MDADRILHIVSHTHWDREWYMSFQRFRRRFVKLMDHLINLLESNEDYKFFTLDGQVLVLKDYFEIRSENKEKVMQLVKEGRLLIGPWYSQPNDFMVSGEALIRNLMLGIKESMALGAVMKVCYLPDAFGNISQLPQIIKGFDIEDVVGWRGKPGGYKSVFKWKGADGTECMMFYLCTGYGNAIDLPLDEEEDTRYVDMVPKANIGLHKRIDEIIASLDLKAATPQFLLMNGIDHSFAQSNLPEVINKINLNNSNVKAVHSNLPKYINEVKKYCKEKGVVLQEFTGEQRDPKEVCILSGSQSTRNDIKIINNKVEGLFEKWMEPFATFAWILGSQYPQAEIWKAWEYLLQNHAHDSIACSCIDSTYHQVLTRFEWSDELGSEIVNDSLQLICNKIDAKGHKPEQELLLVVFNPLVWERNEVITATVDVPEILNFKNPVIIDGDIRTPVQLSTFKKTTKVKYNPRKGNLDDYEVNRFELSFKAEKIPAVGYKAFRLVDEGKQCFIYEKLIVSHRAMENEFIRVEINNNGTLGVLDKQSGHKYENLHFFEDCGEAGNGFEHEKPLRDKVIYSIGAASKISVIENGPYKATFKIEISMDIPIGISDCRKSRKEELTPVSIVSCVTLKADEARVDIETAVVNRSGDHRLRVLFPTGIQSKYSYAGQPFDVVAREVKLPDFNKYPNEKPSPTHPQLTFVDVNDGNKGLMLANQGLYEYEVTDDKDRSIALTLLRCTDRIYSTYFAECEDLLIPEAQCLGEYIFNYSIIPHSGSWDKVYKNAYEYRFPLKAIVQSSLEEENLTDFNREILTKTLPDRHSFIHLEPDSIMVSAIKKSEQSESLIIRVFNPSDSAADGRLRVDFPGQSIISAYQTSLNEQRLNSLISSNGCIEMKVPGKGLITVEVLF